MAIVGRAGEYLARSINRRQALKRAAVAIFGAAAAFAVEGVRPKSALAGVCGYVTAGDCSCNPPGGQYCGELDGSFCSGSVCSGGCEVDESFRYVGGCWCSATCSYNGDNGRITGYYKCCDCNCYGTQCACREFVQGTSEDQGGMQVRPVPGGAVNVDPSTGGFPGSGRPGGFPDGFPGGQPGGGFPGGMPGGSQPGEFPSGFPFGQ